MSSQLADLVSVETTDETGHYVTKSLPIRLGNSMPIAYGGCALGAAVSAAYATVDSSSMSLYSVLGHYLGPASTAQKLHCKVERTRDTRSFATRRVQVSQVQPNGSSRICLDLLADFHVIESSTVAYSAPPSAPYAKPEDCPEASSHVQSLVKRGDITQAFADGYAKQFGISDTFFETRPCLNGVGSQNVMGAVKDVKTSQDDRHITAKSSAEWQIAKEPLKLQSEHMAALSFLMDGGLSFLPLSHSSLWFDDVDACASLDFALRIFVPTVDMNSWLLRERTTSRGGGGRTYSEGRLWDTEGNMVASMTQQSILRVKKGTAKSLL